MNDREYIAELEAQVEEMQTLVNSLDKMFNEMRRSYFKFRGELPTLLAMFFTIGFAVGIALCRMVWG